MNTLSKKTDEELVKLYADGQNEAFDILLARYKRKVFSSIMLTVKDYDVANDIFQDTFIKAITTIRSGQYDERGKFGGWIMRIAHNLTIDTFRRSNAMNTVSGDSTEDEEEAIFDTIQILDRSHEDELIEEQFYKDLVGLVGLLPENQQEVVKMRFIQDMSFKEIADATNVSLNTALGRMRYALLNLRRLVSEKHLAMDA